MVDDELFFQNLKNKTIERLKKYVQGPCPNILYMIKQEMLNDSQLCFFIKNFQEKNSDEIRLNLIEDILVQITQAQDIPKDLYKDGVNARHFFVLEILDSLSIISFVFNKNLLTYKLIEEEFENLKIDTYIKLINQLKIDEKIIEESKMKHFFEMPSFKSVFRVTGDDFINLSN